MAIKIKSTKNSTVNGIKCLVYGKAGIGKTTLMGTAPKPIILSCENGMLALKNKDIPYITVKTVEDIDEAYEKLSTRASRREFKTICLDSISEMAEDILEAFLKKRKDPRKAYGDMFSEVVPIVKQFRDIERMNVVFSAKRKRVADEDTGLTQYIASMPGKAMVEFLPYQFDEVFHMDIHEDENGREKRVLWTQPSLEYDAKDRSGALLKKERPNLTNIFNKISKEKV